MLFNQVRVSQVFKLNNKLYQKTRKDKAYCLDDYTIETINNDKEVEVLNKQETKKLLYSK